MSYSLLKGIFCTNFAPKRGESKMTYILAHDLGTSGNKATIFSKEGELIASYVATYDTAYFQ